MPEKVKCRQCSKLFTGNTALEQHQETAHPSRPNSSALLNAAEDRLYEFLTSDGTDRSLRELANKAVIVYASEARREASKNNALSAALQMARAVTNSKAEIRRIVTASLPGHAVSVALKEGEPK